MAKPVIESSTSVLLDLIEKLQMRVLHVDDEVSFLKITKEYLEAEGSFQVAISSSVEDAYGKMKREEFDVIVSDYMMPGKDGLEFLKELREEKNEIPFIIFTGKGREEVATRALNLGADQYLNKLGNTETVYAELAHSIRKAVKIKEAEKALHESHQKLERLFMDSPEAMVYLSPDSHILDINQRFSELFEYSLEEIKGRHINDIVVPSEKKEEAEILDMKAGKGCVYFDTVRKKKEGSLVPVSISAAPIIVEDELMGYVASYKDISDLKATEKALKETMEKLATMNEKLRVVGRLTRHDVRNKLAVIAGNVFLAKRRLLGNNSSAQEFMDEIDKACRQVVGILDFSKNYEMLGVEELVYMNVGNAFDEAISLFSSLYDVKTINGCHGLTVLADSLLRQLFYNLVDNSLKYGEKVSRIEVCYKKLDGERIELVYQDDGVGISEKDEQDLFREGYGKGTGYGLYLIREMMEVYGWKIQETGAPGKGVRFTITIPKTGRSGKENYQLH